MAAVQGDRVKTATREKPVLFAGPMVKAILEGRKTQTRRLIGLDTLRRSETPGYDWTWRGQAPVRSIAQQKRHPRGCWQDVTHEKFLSLLPYAVGDVLWVRETWTLASRDGYRQYAGLEDERYWPSTMDRPHVQSRWNWVHNVIYRADGEYVADDGVKESWHPSLHMERWMSRLSLEVTAVRVERLQDISREDAIAEGVPTEPFEGTWNGEPATIYPTDPTYQFAVLWNQINGVEGPKSWNANPWVAVYEFKRCERPS
jgi:hypothetical protein